MASQKLPTELLRLSRTTNPRKVTSFPDFNADWLCRSNLNRYIVATTTSSNLVWIPSLIWIDQSTMLVLHYTNAIHKNFITRQLDARTYLWPIIMNPCIIRRCQWGVHYFRVKHLKWRQRECSDCLLSSFSRSMRCVPCCVLCSIFILKVNELCSVLSSDCYLHF